MNIRIVLNYLIKRLRLPSALLTSQYALMLEYRAEIVLWAISGILPLFMLGIWKEADMSLALGLSNEWLTRYFVSAFIVRQFTAVWVMTSFEEDNLDGRLSPLLLQPLFPFWRYYFSHIAEQVSRLPIVILIIGFLVIALPGFAWLPSLSTLIFFLLALFLSFTVRFLLHWLFAMICFWTDKASALERLLLIPYLFLSGLVAPLEAFPPSISSFALYTPFPYILSFPANILAGSKVHLIEGFLALFLWGLLFLILGYFLWKKGVRFYSGMGA
mgnify:CR=1 FL=1